MKNNIPSNEFLFDVDSELKKAVQYHRSGQLQEAENIYKEILKINPNHPDCLYLLGLMAHQTGENDKAVDLINKAIENDPDNAVYHNDLGNAFLRQNKIDEAISCYETAVQLKPDLSEAHYNMGNAFLRQRRLNEAISCYQKALHLNPDDAEVYNYMANAFRDQGNLNEAISCYQQAIQLKPDYALAHNSMGIAFERQGKLNEAIPCYQQAIQLKPDYAEAYYNMGNAFLHHYRLNEAAFCYQKALEFKPDYAEAYNNMGNAFRDQGKLNEAISCCQKALQLKPDYAEFHYNMGNALMDQDNVDKALSCYQEAIQLKPDYAEAYVSLFVGIQLTCAWQKLEGLREKLDDLTRKALDDGTKVAETPFLSLSRHAHPSRNLAVAKSWSSDIARSVSNLNIHFPFDDRGSLKSKIAVGYLSNDFRDHPVAHLMLSLFGLHNRDEFEVFCYSYGEDDGSYYRKRIQQDCDKFVDLRNLSHADAARCIYEDAVDILVDLKGYTKGNRLAICALRPSPIQVRYLGLAGTTGADFFDYTITDRIVTPENHARHYSDNLVYLPHCYQVNDHTRSISNKDWKRGDFGLPEGSFVFCSFNQPYKIEPSVFDVWMNILRQVPESVLWLQKSNETAEKNLRQEADARGVKPERLIFSEKLPRQEHLGRLRLADLALDTRLVNGAATTSDALWAGVPVITLKGGHFASRMSSSILAAIGLSELTAHSLDNYKALAVRLARNPHDLKGIKQRLVKNRVTEPLFDTPRFVRNIEKAYKEMWQIFLAEQRPRQIEVVES
jgi:protein O-GlcNAc transferase